MKKSRLHPATFLLIALITLCLLWELWLSPLRSPMTLSLLVLIAIKITPLCVAAPGFFQDRIYTHKWMSLAIWLYFVEGAVRGWSEQGFGRYLAMVEAVLSVLLFAACVLRIRQARTSALLLKV